MSDELSHSLLTYIDQRLSIAADKPTSYNVAELLGPYPNQGGKRRLEQLVSLTDTQAVFVDERVFRPQVAFETMHTAHNAIRGTPRYCCQALGPVQITDRDSCAKTAHNKSICNWSANFIWQDS